MSQGFSKSFSQSFSVSSYTGEWKYTGVYVFLRLNVIEVFTVKRELMLEDLVIERELSGWRKLNYFCTVSGLMAS